MIISICKDCGIKIVDTRWVGQKAHDYCSECKPKRAPCCCKQCGQMMLLPYSPDETSNQQDIGLCHDCIMKGRQEEAAAAAKKKQGRYETCELCDGFGTIWDDDDDEHHCHECNGIGDVWVEGEKEAV